MIGACDDGDPCTVGDACGGGKCLAGARPLDCDDGNECIKNYCKDVFEFCEAEYDDSGRCRSSLRPDGTECIPPGKGAGSCQDGLCIPLDGGISGTGGQAPP